MTDYYILDVKSGNILDISFDDKETAMNIVQFFENATSTRQFMVKKKVVKFEDIV